MMIRKYLLPTLAVAGLAVTAYTVMTSQQQLAAAPPVAAPAPSPYRTQIAGAGIVEAASENLAVGTPVSGIVVEVPVVRGALVKRGEILFRIDDRERAAELAQRVAEAAAAQAEIARLQALPRAEDVPPAQAQAAAARSALEEARSQLASAESVGDKRAISVEELARRRFAVQLHEAQLASAEAELARLEAGAWEPDLAVARAKLEAANAAVSRARTELERLAVRAPIDATVLQLNVRLGEHADSGSRAAHVLLGDLSRLHVRIDIDESDAWRFRPGSKGRASVRGNAQLATEIEFVRVDPYVVPKRSLTGDTLERIDTRVLQVIYGFDAGALQVYVGQQMDVFLEDAALGERP